MRTSMRGRTRSRTRGMTLIETLISALMMVFLGAGLWTLMRSTYDSQYEITAQNTTNLNARQAVDELMDQLRGAKALTAAAASDVSFTDASNNTVRYWKSGSSLVKSVNGLPSAGTQVATGVSSLTFTYYPEVGTTWQAATSSPSTPANVVCLDCKAQVTINGSSRQITGSVQIRQKRPQ